MYFKNVEGVNWGVLKFDGGKHTFTPTFKLFNFEGVKLGVEKTDSFEKDVFNLETYRMSQNCANTCLIKNIIFYILELNTNKYEQEFDVNILKIVLLHAY